MSDPGDFIIENGVLKKYVGPGGDVVIPDGVREIGIQAFADCRDLTSVTIPEGVTAVEYNSFSGCVNLLTVIFPESLKRIGIASFNRCISLSNVIIPDNVNEIGYAAFSDCSSLTNLTINATEIRIADRAFAGCFSLSDADGFVFVENTLYNYCGSGGNVVLPANITKIEDRAFFGQTELTGVIIPEGVTNLGADAFRECSGLKEVLIPNSVTNIGARAFCRCTSLIRVEIPDSVINIGNEAFLGCHCLVKTRQWTQMLSDAVKGCDHLRFLTKDPLTVFPTNRRRQALLGYVEAAEAETNSEPAASYIEYARKNAGKLVSEAFDFPALLLFLCKHQLISSKDIDAYLTEAEKRSDIEKKALLLNYQHNLGQETVANVRARKEKVQEAYAEAFEKRSAARDPSRGIEGLTFVITGGLSKHPPVWKSLDEVKEYLESYGATLGASVTKQTDYLVTNDTNSGSDKSRKAASLGVQIISEEDFNDTVGKRLKERANITIPAWLKTVRYGTVSTVRPGNKTVETIEIAEGIKKIENGAFYNCKSLKSVTIPDSVTSIGKDAFKDCAKLQSLIIPKKIKTINDATFWGCQELSSVTIPCGVKKIGNFSFFGCSSLEQLILPEGVMSIGKASFQYCGLLKELRLPKSLASIGEDGPFYGCPNLTIHAPASSYAEQYAKDHGILFVAEED